MTWVGIGAGVDVDVGVEVVTAVDEDNVETRDEAPGVELDTILDVADEDVAVDDTEIDVIGDEGSTGVTRAIAVRR